MRLPPDIGLSSAVFAELTMGAALEHLAPYTELVEIDSYGLHTLLSPRVRREAIASGLSFTVHGPADSDLRPGSPDDALRQAAVATHRRHLEAGAEIGATVYLVHPDLQAHRAPRDPAVIAALQRTIADLERAQRDTGVRVVLENLPLAGHSHFVAPGELDLGELGLALDAGHAAISGTLDAFLQDPRARLAHVHLHDNHGFGDASDPHLALGRGVVDSAAVLAAARAASAAVILEHFDEATAVESIAYLEKRGLLDSG